MVGTCEMTKSLLVDIGEDVVLYSSFEHQNLKLHYHMKLRVPTTKV